MSHSNASSAPSPRAGLEPERCVVLVPVGHHIEPACEAGLRDLERRGYPVRRVRGYSAIDQGRSQMATDVLAAGFEETMWIDSDIGFDPDSVDKLRSHNLPIVCGIYPQKHRRALAVHVLPDAEKIIFGQGGGLLELLYSGLGFLHVRREVYQKMIDQLELPVCNERFGRPLVPFFQPLIKTDRQGPWYLTEDYAFCERARQCGYRIMADSRIRLEHFGTYGFTWEDAGGGKGLYQTYHFQLTRSPAERAGMSRR